VILVIANHYCRFKSCPDYKRLTKEKKTNL
jgi:hypothetical protein